VSTLERAIALAATAHSGQLDKAGKPYILHPLRVMLAVETPEERLAAMLHDVVEDTSVTLDELRAEGFPDAVIAAVDALTKRADESRLDAAKRAAQDPIARRVKLADVRDNMDLRRLPNPGPRDYARLEEYRAVEALLQARDET
jgi:guanosine-3',5'-bis(diphosphate) 3'-pyrophosphohydrolase